MSITADTKISYISPRKHKEKNLSSAVGYSSMFNSVPYDTTLANKAASPTGIRSGIGIGTKPRSNTQVVEYNEQNGDGKKLGLDINQIPNIRIDTNGHITSGNNPIENKVSPSLDKLMDNIHATLNLPTSEYSSYYQAFKQTTKYYNRFKAINPNEYLMRGIPHVFFVRPCCNIFDEKSSSGSLRLVSELTNNEKFIYAFKSCPEILKELSLYGHTEADHHFMLSLSNHIKGFPLNAEYINTDTYGRTFTGYKIAYGKNNIESKTASNIELTFNDDRNLHIYQLHQLWIEYINGVYRGLFSPRKADIFNKVLDYTSAIYYILTAEDGETIIYWCKFYGVFPTTAPSDQLSWAAGQFVVAPEISISYQYSFKEEYNPTSLLELNYNSSLTGYDENVSKRVYYTKTYDEALGNTGSTWVGVPFVEAVSDKAAGQPLTYVLRFKTPTRKQKKV